MKRDMLSPEEREEFDALMYEAGHDENGNVLPSGEIGHRVHQLLEDALQAGRPWAGYELHDSIDAGCLKSWKDWHKAQRKVRVFRDGKLIPKTAAMGIQRREVETGVVYHQQAFWEEMTADDLRRLIASSRSRIESERVTIAAALRLLAAIEETGQKTVAEAMTAMGTTVDEFLAADNPAA